MLAVADDFGRVQLWPYPCASNKCFDKTYRGHSSHVTNVRYVLQSVQPIQATGICTFTYMGPLQPISNLLPSIPSHMRGV